VKNLALLLETLGGARSGLESLTPGKTLVRTGWWIALFLLVLSFVGRGAKFIYVDF
jgi:hypothetical protein